MRITEFVNNFINHPVLFVGAGLSFRYLKNSYTWDGLLSKISEDLWGNDEHYLDIKEKCTDNGVCRMAEVATILEEEFNEIVTRDRNGKFKEINDIFYEEKRKNGNSKLSRFKIYISTLIKDLSYKEEKKVEIEELKKARKNIGSVITTNYDKLIEDTFDFKPLVGNDILLSNPYGSIYKIHGCVDDVKNIIITQNDYENFDRRYELIRAQLLSLFIHNPIIFLGYGVGDENIKKILKTIFSYIPFDTEEAEKVRRNFLLVEYEKDSDNTEITDHDITIDGNNIRINKLKTDNFTSLYQAIANLTLPISAMDVRKVQNVVKEIYSGGKIKVMITENMEDMKNNDRILAIGSSKTIQYTYLTTKEMIREYFKIMEESNSAAVSLLNKQNISESQYFPLYGFSFICKTIDNINNLKNNQKKNIENYIKKSCSRFSSKEHNTINEIFEDVTIANSYKSNAILYSVFKKHISIEELEHYLKEIPSEQRNNTEYRRLLCLYDLIKYGSANTNNETVG